MKPRAPRAARRRSALPAVALTAVTLLAAALATGWSPQTAAAQVRAPAEQAAEALFAELGAAAPGGPLFAVASLDVVRAGVRSRLMLRLHVRGPGHVLVQIRELPPRSGAAAARPRQDGTVLLLHDGRVHLWFPRADLQLAVPGLLAGSRLCGSDFALDHLLALLGDGSRWRAADVSPASFGAEEGRLLTLRPREDATGAPADTSFAALELQLVRGPQGAWIARQLDGFDAAGVLVSRVRLAATGQLGLPDTWTAWTLPARAGAATRGAAASGADADASTLRLSFLERDPPVAPETFLPAALPAWR